MRRGFRTWGEAYGISVIPARQADFVGDQPAAPGAASQASADVAPGVNLGVFVDQSPPHG